MAKPVDGLPVGGVAWLMTGQEGYGVLRAVTTLAGGLKREGVRVDALVLEDGPAVLACEAAGMGVKVLGVGVPPDFAGGLGAKAVGVVRAWAYRRRVLPAVVEGLSGL
ncbi:MAG: hypothetical protein AAF797_14075, partial [Planctomycetota bacterium]